MTTRAILARLLPLALAVGIAVYLVGIYDLLPRWGLALVAGGLILASAFVAQWLLSTRRS